MTERDVVKEAACEVCVAGAKFEFEPTNWRELEGNGKNPNAWFGLKR